METGLDYSIAEEIEGSKWIWCMVKPSGFADHISDAKNMKERNERPWVLDLSN